MRAVPILLLPLTLAIQAPSHAQDRGPPPPLIDAAQRAGWSAGEATDDDACGAALFVLALSSSDGSTIRTGPHRDLAKRAIVRARNRAIAPIAEPDLREIALVTIALTESAVHSEYRLLRKPVIAATSELQARLSAAATTDPIALAWSAIAAIALEAGSRSVPLAGSITDEPRELTVAIAAQLARVPDGARARDVAALALSIARDGIAAADQPTFVRSAAAIEPDDLEALAIALIALGTVSHDERMAGFHGRLAHGLSRPPTATPAAAVGQLAVAHLARLAAERRSWPARSRARLVVTVTRNGEPATVGFVSLTSRSGSGLWRGAAIGPDGTATFDPAPPGAFTAEWCSADPRPWLGDESLPARRIELAGAEIPTGRALVEITRAIDR